MDDIREALYDWCFNSCPLLLGDEQTFAGLVRLVKRLVRESRGTSDNRRESDETLRALHHDDRDTTK
jgi:hypothetical protein